MQRASTVLAERSKIEYGRGIIAGLAAGFTWAFVTGIGIAIVVAVYHDKLVAYVQPRIPPPQPLLPGFPELGSTTPPTADQLIQEAVGMAVASIFFTALISGPVLGIIFAWLEKTYGKNRNIIKNSILFSLLADTLYIFSQFAPPYSPLGNEARIFGAFFSLLSASAAGIALGVAYGKLGDITSVQTELDDYQTGKIVSAPM